VWPLTEISPFFLTISAVSGFRIDQEIADEPADVAGAIGHTCQIHHRLRPALNRLEIEGIASPPPREIGRRSAVIGERRESKHRSQHLSYGATNGHDIFLHQRSGVVGTIALMRNQTAQIVPISRPRFIKSRCKALLSGKIVPAAMTTSVVNTAHPSA
jgi:hypothetical protein